MNWKYLNLLWMLMFVCCSEESKNEQENCLDIIMSMEKFDELVVDPTTTIDYAEIRDNYISLDLIYTGGCEEHEIQLIGDGTVAYSLPPQIWLYIHHDNDDPCDGLIAESWEYNLSDIATTIGEVIIHLEGWEDNLHFKP